MRIFISKIERRVFIEKSLLRPKKSMFLTYINSYVCITLVQGERRQRILTSWVLQNTGVTDIDVAPSIIINYLVMIWDLWLKPVICKLKGRLN